MHHPTQEDQVGHDEREREAAQAAPEHDGEHAAVGRPLRLEVVGRDGIGELALAKCHPEDDGKQGAESDEDHDELETQAHYRQIETGLAKTWRVMGLVCVTPLTV